MELALYNGALAGLARDGTHYFYQNPLESDGSHKRWEWHPCPCCTMNISRLVASIGGYFYSTARDVVAVHLYGGSTARLEVGGTHVKVRQQADYPWSGAIKLAVEPERPTTFALRLRIPSWARNTACTVNGEPVDTTKRNRGYVEIEREWKNGDAVALELPMPVERLYAHPNVKADLGRVALRRGPLVYCLEQIDNGNTPIGLIRLPRDTRLEPTDRPDLFGGIVTIIGDAKAVDLEDRNSLLYRSRPDRLQHARLTAVPYYVWSNRGPNRMAVWVPEG